MLSVNTLAPIRLDLRTGQGIFLILQRSGPIEISMLKPRFDPFRFSRPTGPTQQQRRQMIADAAYRRAELRGFSRGNEVQDWLAAEREVDSALSLQFLKFY
jgi:hypothetical protein